MLSIIKNILQNEIQDALQDLYQLSWSEDLSMSIPPNIELGDIAIECFMFAKELKKSPVQIAQELAAHLSDSMCGNFTNVGPYLNVTLDNQLLFENTCTQKLAVKKESNKTIMIEYLSPNTNKPLHLGHMRNGLLGMATSNLLEYSGHQVVKANLVNDRGIHICKSMLAWQKYGENKTPENTQTKGDHFVGDYYVLFAQKLKEDPKLLEEAQDLLQKWEQEDGDTRKLWEDMNSWVYKGFEETFKTLGFQFDITYFESEIYQNGKDIIQKGLKENIFKQESDNSITFPLSQKEFGTNKDGSERKITLLRDNGTSLYVTQDIATAEKKAKDYPLDGSVYIVAEEQEYYFKTLFTIFKALGYPWADNCHHLSYGMVELPDGKMKSREGTVVDADDLIEQVTQMALVQIQEKNTTPISQKEAKERAQKIALGAIKFYFLNKNPKQKMIFNPQESLSFEGVTGPYIQYAYTRIQSIIKEARSKGYSFEEKEFDLLGHNLEERKLALLLLFFEEKIQAAALNYNPSLLTNTLYEIAKYFHQFYAHHRVMQEDKKLTEQRLALIQYIGDALKKGLHILEIEVLNKM
jgi:arginyl-tRNA synthetase